MVIDEIHDDICPNHHKIDRIEDHDPSNIVQKDLWYDATDISCFHKKQEIEAFSLGGFCFDGFNDVKRPRNTKKYNHQCFKY